jgi:hypothetical protein
VVAASAVIAAVVIVAIAAVFRSAGAGACGDGAGDGAADAIEAVGDVACEVAHAGDDGEADHGGGERVLDEILAGVFTAKACE